MIHGYVPKKSVYAVDKPEILWQGNFLDGKLVIVKKRWLDAAQKVAEIYFKISAYDFEYDGMGEVDTKHPDAITKAMELIEESYKKAVQAYRDYECTGEKCTDCGEVHETKAILH